MKRMMISSMLLVSAIWAVCAEERIEEAIQEQSETEKVTTYRIHLYKNADGSEVAYVVGVDGQERPVMLLDPDEYKLLTGRLDAVWQSLNATEDGRIKLHGKRERTEIDEKARKKVQIYADGYKHTETIPEKRNKPPVVKMTRLQEKIIEEQKPKWMSDRHRKARRALLKRKQGVPKQVTIEHDAVTGKDTVVEGK